jgi:osmotically-inducible protein OsmY
MRKATLINGILFVTVLLALVLTGCTPKEPAESAAPAATTEPATDTAAAAPATDATTAATDTAAATTDTSATAALTDTAAAATPEQKLSAKLVEVFGDDAKTITITLVDGKAILTGKVNERSTQELAEQVALYFPEIKKVDNQLAATNDRGLGKGQMKDEAADAALESAAKGALAKEIGEYAKDVSVEVAAGVVCLRGTVPDAARHKLATEAMSRVKDITKVVDLLRVK